MLHMIRKNKFTFFLCSRQVGKSFLVGYAAVETCWTKPRSKVVILSSGERSSLEVLDKCKRIANIFQIAFTGTIANLDIEITASEVRFSNGSKIITLPSGDPSRIRGYSPTLTIADEFSTQHDQSAFYASVYPFVTNPFGGDKKLVIVGTPLGTQNLFWRLWEEKNDFAKYSLTIHQAKQMGLKVDLDLLKRNIPDEDMWKQEYECTPVDAITSLFTYELLNSCIYTNKPKGIIRYAGMDIGRHSDRTSIVILATTSDGKTFIEDIKTFQNMEFRQQFKEAASIIKALHIRKMCVDATGLGMQLAEDLQRDFGPIIHPVTFTNQNKVEMFNGLKKAFSDGSCLIPDNPDLLKEFQSIKRVITANSISYQAERDDSGHADNAVASALAHYAYVLSNRDVGFIPIAF